MAEKVIALSIQVRGTKEETAKFIALQREVDQLKKEIKDLNAAERQGLVTAKEASAQRAQLSLQLKANQNAYRDLEATILKSNDALRKNSGFVAGIKEAIDKSLPSFREFAAAAGLAFGVHEIIAFTKASVHAFIEAERNANRLSFALRNVAKEADDIAFERLIKQSEDLQRRGIFSDDGIQTIQLAAINFGLTADEVEKLIPLALDLAAATGQDLNTVMDALLRGIEGNAKGLKLYGIQLDEGASRTENFANITDQLTKFQGANADALNTTAGRIEHLKNNVDDLQESFGEKFIKGLQRVADLFSVITGNATIETQTIKEELQRRAKIEADAIKERGVAKAAQRALQLDQEIKDGNESLKFLLELQRKGEEVSQREIERERANNLQRKLTRDELIRFITASEKKETDVRKLTIDELKKLDTIAARDELDRREKLEEAKRKAAEKAGKEMSTWEKNRLKDLDKELKKISEDFKSENIFGSIAKAAPAAIEQTDLLTASFEELIRIADEAAASSKSPFTEFETAQIRIGEFLEKNGKAIQQFANQSLAIYSEITNIQNVNSENRIKNINREAEAQTAAIDNEIERRRKLGQDTESLEKKKQSIVDGARKKEEAEQRKVFERNKRLSIASATISGAEAIVKGYAMFGPPPSPLGIASAIAQAVITALQIAAISKQTFAEGGIIPDGGGIIKGASHANGGVKFSSGGVVHEAQGGEPILVKEAGDDPATRSVLSAINQMHGGRAFAKGGIVPSHRFQTGGLIPSFTTRSALSSSSSQSSGDTERILSAFERRVSNIKVRNVVSETVSQAGKVGNIQNEVDFR